MPRRGPGPMAKPQNAGKTIKRLISYLTAYKGLLALVFLCILVSSGAMLYGTYQLKVVINDFILPFIGQNNPDLTAFAKTMIVLIGVFILGSVAIYANNRLMIYISTKVLFTVRTELFQKMESLPIKYHDAHVHGETMSLYTNDIDTMRDMLSQIVPQLMSSMLTVISVFVMMVIISPLLTLIVIAMIFLVIFLVGLIGKKSGKAFKEQQAAIGKVNGYIEEMIEGQKVVQVFCQEEKIKKGFVSLNDALCEAGTRANSLANSLGPLTNNLGHINYAVTAIAGILLIIRGTLDVGSLASFLQYSKNFTQPISQLSQLFNGVLNALAGSERVFKLLDEKSETDDGYVTLVNANILPDGTITEAFLPTGQWAWKHPHGDGTLTYTKLKGEVTFDNVNFGYVPEKTVLKNISLTAKPGQKIALVGSTGSGKTTVTNLINRFYDVPDGKIRFDGINVNKIKKNDLRRSLGMVLQDTHLFTGSIADNIRFGKLDASFSEVKEAAKLANADFFIRHLHEGYDTVITGDGGNLSQGQRQLLAIARAAIANPPVLILDEATSSIDTRTESLIEKGMDKLMEGRTVFVIAHRLSTVRNADKILVLEDGNIIESGNHEELLAQKGKYYQLYMGMFELS